MDNNNYPSLSPQNRRRDSVASKAFEELTAQLEITPDQIDPSVRRAWIRVIILDLAAQAPGRTEWSSHTLLRALTTLKLLGRSPIATDDLASHIPLFTRYANLRPLFTPQSDDSAYTPECPSPYPSDRPIVQESLRILANTLFLHPLSRSSHDLMPTLVTLATLALSQDPNSSSDESDNVTGAPDSAAPVQSVAFLASRVIFLMSAVPSVLVIELVERTPLVIELKEALSQELSARINSRASPGSRLAPDTLTELLKAIFNLMVQYPRSIKEFGSPNSLSPSLSSNQESSLTQSPSGAPSPELPGRSSGSIRQRIINQMNLKKIAAKSRISSFREHKDHLDNPDTKSCRIKTAPLSREPDEPTSNVTAPELQIFSGLLPHLIQLFLMEPILDQLVLKPPLTSYMHTFLNFSYSAQPFFDCSYQLSDEIENLNGVPPLISKVITVLERTTQRYDFPDQNSTRDKCRDDRVDLETDLTQVFLLAANLISPNLSGLGEEGRETLRQKIVPDHIDRSTSLNEQSNFIGRILRILGSVSLDSLKLSCGGFLYALYDEDADRLISQVGYGPLAGYLVAIGKGMMNVDSKHQPTPEVNPITGTYWKREEETGTSGQMTEKEKEAEAERLCELFDRINANGIMKVQDPRKIAVETGRFAEIETSLDQQTKEQDLLDEQEALADLKRYKERNNKKL